MLLANENLKMWSTQDLTQSAFENENLRTSLWTPIPPPVSAEIYKSLKPEPWQFNKVNGCCPTSNSTSDEDESNDENFFYFTFTPSFYTSQTYYSTFDTPFGKKMSNINYTSKPLVNGLYNSSHYDTIKENMTSCTYMADAMDAFYYCYEAEIGDSDYEYETSDDLHHIKLLDNVPEPKLTSIIAVKITELPRRSSTTYDNQQDKALENGMTVGVDSTLHDSVLPLPHSQSPECHTNRLDPLSSQNSNSQARRHYLPRYDNQQDKALENGITVGVNSTLHGSVLPLPHSQSPECHTNRLDPLSSQNSNSQARRHYLPRYNQYEIEKSFSGVRFIDTHCHLDFLFKKISHRSGFEDFRKTQNFPVSYEGCVAVFCNPSTFAQKYFWKPIIEEDHIWAAFGCHPHHAYNYNDSVHAALVRALEHDKVRALGEIGLDYSDRNNCPKAIQHQVFKRQLELAVAKALPLVIHNRDAFEDTIEIMKKFVPRDHKIHMHCCMDSWETAKTWLDTFPNLFIGLTNVITYTSAINVHNTARNIPLDRLLLETDAPYFIPRIVPKTTKWSHPGMAIHVAAQVAALRNISLEETLKAVRKNTTDMYGI